MVGCTPNAPRTPTPAASRGGSGRGRLQPPPRPRRSRSRDHTEQCRAGGDPALRRGPVRVPPGARPCAQPRELSVGNHRCRHVLVGRLRAVRALHAGEPSRRLAGLADAQATRRDNAGCIFELEEIVRRVPIDRVVFVCDRTTDLQFLQDVLRPAWTAASAEGLALGDGRVAVVPIERQSRAEPAGLWKRLAQLTSQVSVISIK